MNNFFFKCQNKYQLSYTSPSFFTLSLTHTIIMPTSSFSVITSASSCYSFCNSRPHEGHPCYDPMGKTNKKILSLHSINKRLSKLRNHIPIIIIASSRSKMSITTGIREDGEDEIPPPLLQPRIISKPKPMALFAEPSPYE